LLESLPDLLAMTDIRSPMASASTSLWLTTNSEGSDSE
jgi:hypothetical protein